MKNTHQFLQQLGLSENEIKIYLCSLGIGQTTSSILGKKVGLTRSTARYTCQSLVSKNIMNCITRKDHFLFTAESPKQLKNILQKEKAKIEGKITQFENVLPELEKHISPYASIPKVKYYQGIAWVIEIFEDVLHEESSIYWVVRVDEHIDPEVKEYIDNIYIPKRKKVKLPTYAIFNNNSETQKYMENDQEVNRHTLLLPENDFPFPGSFYIYWSKIAFFSFTYNNLHWVVIENKNILDTQISLFKIAWKMAKQHPLNQKR